MGEVRLLLGSGGFRGEERREFLVESMRAHFGDARSILFVPFALHDHDGYVRALQESGLDAGYRLDGLHAESDPVAAIARADGIYVGGGNTFRLAKALHEGDLMHPIREAVFGGTPYLGVSAGTNVACPTIMTTNDMPIVQPPNFSALALIGFQINPHFVDGRRFHETPDGLHEHFGESRADRIREFHEMHPDPVLGLWEGALLSLSSHEGVLRGGPARLFRRGEDPVDLPEDSSIGPELGLEWNPGD